MCNPRRVTITATRELAENWEREITRTVNRRGTARGEARVVQDLALTQGRPVLALLPRVLEAGLDDWTREGETWRHAVEGGYLRYTPADHRLEIVAVAEDRVEVTADARQRLQGQVRGRLEAEGLGRYYDDGWGGHTEDKAERQAEEDAQQKLDRAARERIQSEGDRAEAEADAQLTARAEAQAEEALAARREAERVRLEEEAAARLDRVGVRARQVVNRLLGAAYRQAILDHGAQRGATVVRDDDAGDVIEIELMMN
ncbi:MAG: molecular chaperone DnaJ [Acidobacteriota bacterium]|nr:molecular chaperone DnaJ [Acidobacteriota bacterium]